MMEPHTEIVQVLEEEFINYAADAETTCTICQAEFLDPEDLAIHLLQIHKKNDLIYRLCVICAHKYTDLLTYAEHFRDKHLVGLKYCNYCLRAFTDEDEFGRHEKYHKRSKNATLNCTQCNKKVGTVTELRKHDFEMHNNNNDGFMIQPLLTMLSAVLNIKAETILLSLQTETVFFCVACDYSTASIDLYIKHSRQKNCQTYVCSKCSNVYKKKYTLKRHLSLDCGKSVKLSGTVTCPKCLIVFKKYLYPAHKKTCQNLKCSSCDIHFKSMYELSEHQSNEHPLSVDLKTCNFCWKQCVGSVALKKHMDRSHRPEFHLYKYFCVYCKTMFKHPQKLFGHFFSKHKDIQPYTCKICGDKKFRLRKKFTLHIKLVHQSIGFVEFDENYHVFFTEKKSENPFIPKSLYTDQIEPSKDSDKPEDTNNMNILNINSEMSVTETEGNQTEAESAPKPTLKRKRVPKQNKTDTDDAITIDSSDDEPLLVVKKRVQKSMPKVKGNHWKKRKIVSVNKKKLTCNVCNKYCYTVQNYNHHISLHSRKEYKKCIKCFKTFSSREKLNNHIASDHQTSKLTETLKHLIEKRKKGESITDDLPMSEKFRRTIKKVVSCETNSSAKIKEVSNGLSVQKFIENFRPEPENKPEIIVNNVVTFKPFQGKPRQPLIKMTKFEVKPAPSTTGKLSMPVRFKLCNYEKSAASIRLVQPIPNMYQDQSPDSDSRYDADMERNDSIPEVAEEIMLEGTEEAPKTTQIPHKIVIPKFPAEYKDIRIAHLLPQAPYYKIVKVNDVLKMHNAEENKTVAPPSEPIQLPDGTKLVSTNPLAHLLGKTPIEKVMEPIKNKYYKPKVKNFQGMLAEALSNLDRYPRKKKKNVDSSLSDSTSQCGSIISEK